MIAQKVIIPGDWKDYDDPCQFDLGFAEGELQVVANPPDTLFQSATLNRYHVDAARQLSDAFSVYIDGICSAISAGIDHWANSCVVTGVCINGNVGLFAPGSLSGPALAPLILAHAPMAGPQEIAYSHAIANTLGNAWSRWSGLLGGQLMYPSFAMVTGPVAPPTPNTPAVLATFSSAGEMALVASTLLMTMQSNLNDSNALHANSLFCALSEAFERGFSSWKSSTVVQKIVGSGPVPTFSPPTVPAGPVINGRGNGVACLA